MSVGNTPPHNELLSTKAGDEAQCAPPRSQWEILPPEGDGKGHSPPPGRGSLHPGRWPRTGPAPRGVPGSLLSVLTCLTRCSKAEQRRQSVYPPVRVSCGRCNQAAQTKAGKGAQPARHRLALGRRADRYQVLVQAPVLGASPARAARASALPQPRRSCGR